jgi:hypothetical protein
MNAVAMQCDALPEAANVQNPVARREAIANRDKVNRTFIFMYCQAPGGNEIEPEIGSSCDDAAAQAPILCLEQKSTQSPAHTEHCTCWPRLDTKGLTTSPSNEDVPSISDVFPLDQECPTTPRVYGGSFPD